MDLLTQSLDALLLKATNAQNQNTDTAAVEAFTTLILKEKDGAHVGVKVIAIRLLAPNEKEVLQTLNILDICMNKCGTVFQNEVGKFRFLNEMIKLVSPKYLGDKTPVMVKHKVLQLLYVWTLDYPKEVKIKEAYDMLRKQGVIRDMPNPNVALQPPNNINKLTTDSIFYDVEKQKLLQRLLQSTDPEDIQAANWLIKSMVKEDEKLAELKSKRISELESIQNNVRLLSEMLDSYKPGCQEIDLINELYQSCERLKPTILHMAQDSSHSEDILVEVFETSDELRAALHKYQKIIVKKEIPESTTKNLLEIDRLEPTECSTSKTGNVDVLCDIFASCEVPNDAEVLQPEQVPNGGNGKGKNDQYKGLDDLDVLSEQLIKENLGKLGNFRNMDKTPMNLLTKQDSKDSKPTKKLEDLDLTYLMGTSSNSKSPKSAKNDLAESDDYLVDITDEKLIDANEDPINGNNLEQESPQKVEVNLKDVNVKLENIKPSNLPPIVIIDDRNGLTVTLHSAKDKPKENVFVYVITTISKSELPLSNYLCQAIVSKGCKIKLQPPSTTNLPTYNAFLPPTAITQVILLANPNKMSVSIKFIVSYVIDDENITEMGEVEDLPLID
ncbi:unnamed protein product [Brassicogethes aeneus]|uniref:ADP-ribosylation factor-binding protein GGA1 n=1 Tax=Brassicogethes aeneus TaxID=1431903 RepID=A0A9P0FGX2_BRAAE|nr:unnamed protein product [Brassicogethes aeneus]